MNPVDLGIQSQLLLKNDAFKYAVDTVRNDLYQKWVNSNFTDTDNREQIFHLKVALELVCSQLDSFVLQAENEQFKHQEQGN